MQRLVTIALIGGLVWLFMTNRLSLALLDPRPVGIELDGAMVLRTSDDLEARFTRMGHFDDTLMLLGGVTPPLRNAVQHARLTGLPIRDARELAVHAADLHLSNSEGTEQAMDRADSLDLIAGDRISRAAIENALSEVQDMKRSGGERPCLYVRGSHLLLDEIDVPGEKKGLSTDAARAFARSRFVLVEEARLEDCEALLR